VFILLFLAPGVQSCGHPGADCCRMIAAKRCERKEMSPGRTDIRCAMPLAMPCTDPRTDPRTTLRHRFLQCLQYSCWIVGTLALGWYVLAQLSTWRFQQSQAARLETLQLETLRKGSIKIIPLRPGDPFGKISIPRIGLSAMIAEGVDDATLRHAVGHFPRSATPDRAGTVALAGHRDTFFRGLARVRLNDLIELETPSGKYQYQVIRTAVVGPEHVELVQRSSESDLTLVTCFPFYYVGPAPQRFVVQALRLTSQ
jgi:sortase A